MPIGKAALSSGIVSRWPELNMSFSAKPIGFSLVVLLLWLCASTQAFAQTHQTLYPQIPWSNDRQPCWDAAARYHGVDPWLLYAIAKVESGFDPAAINRANRNGSVDTGLMQINSIHYSRLRQFGIEPSALTNACASTFIGAWVLADGQRRYGKTWKAIAAYNVGSLNTPGRTKTGWKYANKVYAAYAKLTGQQYARTASR